jgi:hypothetical protein
VEHSDTLLTIAELAVALAGFASLVSVIGRRQAGRSRDVDGFRLRSMLENAFRVAALALVPLPFLQIAPSDPTVWRLTSGLYLAVTVIYVPFTIHRARSYPGVFRDRWLMVSLLSLSSIGTLTNLANVLGLGGSSAFSLYLASLLVGLGTVGVIFMSVANSLFRAEES